MTWQGVPWFVKDASHPAEVQRALAYIAGNGTEGVVNGTDCKVTASAIPDLNVNVQPGTVIALNKFAGGSSQAYIARNVGADVKLLTAQGSGGVRYDLVALVVEDPQYAGQPAPANVANGPYVRTAVYQNVPATTRTLEEVAPNQTGVALALVKFDASDGTINPADITDLRELAAPKMRVVKKAINSVAAITNLPVTKNVAPTDATLANVRIPKWANRVILECVWSGVQHVDAGSGAGASSGSAAVRLGTLETQPTVWSADSAGVSAPVSATYLAAEDVAIPDALKGTLQTLSALLWKTAGTGLTSRTHSYTAVVLTATFYEVVS